MPTFALRAACFHVAVLLSMRALPFAAYAVVRRGPLARKLLAMGAYATFPLASWELGATSPLLSIYAGFAYYLAVSLGVRPLADRLASGRVTRGATLTALFLAYVFLPGFIFPSTAAQAFLVVGCELALSAYSYCVETSHARAALRPSLGGCLFFLFVNPTLVYTVRGRAEPSPARLAGCLRAAAGAGVMFLNVAWLRPLAQHVRSISTATPSAAGALGFAGFGYAVLRFSTIYAAHSGLASIQIGLARQAGWVVPERYRYPFLATSPLDFWRRWNTYVRVWLEAYVFLPLARHIARRRTRHPAGQVVAVGLTLLVSGAIHGAVVVAGRRSLSSIESPMEFFLFVGIAVALWQGVVSAIEPAIARLKRRSSPAHVDVALRSLARVVVACAVLAASTRWG